MQLLVTECQKALDGLDLAINVKKCDCIRIGRRHSVACLPISLCDGQLIHWSNTITYLGVTIVSATSFNCSFKKAKVNSTVHSMQYLAKLADVQMKW